MSEATPTRRTSARREFTLNFGGGNDITVAIPAQPDGDVSVWAGDQGDGVYAFYVSSDEALELLDFIGGIVDALRAEGRI